MQIHERERELQHEIEELLAAGAPEVEVLAVELLGTERFCVYVDHPDGVDHALCQRVTELLREYLDRYSVDVSSPGPERPLRRRAHFEAAVGRRITLRTAHELGGRRRFRGELVAAGGERITLRVEADTLELPYEEIVRANLIDEGR